MNILFAGTPENSSQILKSLIDLEDIHVKGVISQSDKRGKRGSEVVESFVSKVAKESLIPTFKEDDLNTKHFKDGIADLDIDILLVVAYGKILPNWLLSKPKLMPINIHFSLLPKYRGASPIQSSLIKSFTTPTGPPLPPPPQAVNANADDSASKVFFNFLVFLRIMTAYYLQ